MFINVMTLDSLDAFDFLNECRNWMGLQMNQINDYKLVSDASKCIYHSSTHIIGTVYTIKFSSRFQES